MEPELGGCKWKWGVKSEEAARDSTCGGKLASRAQDPRINP